jgi:UDP-GlcNAc:undecaprenyl-phosphate/decaprenyl-phosphate GlcNAc-1-phosphate transferase
MIWGLAAAFAAMGFAASLGFCAVLMRWGSVDAPDGTRKLQARPIPRLGGVAILLGTLLGTTISFFILILAFQVDAAATFQALIADIGRTGSGLLPALSLSAVAFLLGLWDDIWTANTKLKLATLTALCTVSASLGLLPAELTSPLGDMTLPVGLIIGSALWLLVFINAANFMDGANGLAIGCLAIMLAGLAITGATVGDWAFSVWWFPLFGAIGGFMMHNLSGNLYAGDAGALGLGAVFAGLGLVSGLDVWTVATFALPFLVDVLYTLIWRARRGRHWFDAHLDHAYQRLIASGWSHFETAFLYWGLSLCGAILAYIAARAGGELPFVVFWLLFLAGSVLWIKHRRAAERPDLIS